jgi:hypothetical protein
MFRRTISIIAVMTSLLSRAEGAVLTNVQGAVAASNGSGFVRVSEGAQLAPGALVRTTDGTANIVYENGCAVRVGPRQQVSVLDPPPSCQTGAFDFSPVLGDLSTGEILTDLAVVAGLLAIIIAASIKTKSSGL